MKIALTSALIAAAVAFVSGDVGTVSAVAAVGKPNLRKLEWGGPDGGHGKDGHDEKDREDRDREERERDEKDNHDEEKDREEREKEEREREEHDQKDREEQERREQEERERDREREQDRFDCPPDRPWLCAPTTAPTNAPTALPTFAPTFVVTTTGIFGSGVFGQGDLSQDAEIGLALGVALAFCGACVAIAVIAYRHDMHKILAMKILRSDSQGFNPRMHEHGTAIDISSREDSGRGLQMGPGGQAEPDWGANAGGADSKRPSRKSRSGKTIDF